MIPAALLGDLRRVITGNLDAFVRMTAALGGLAAAVAGYLTGRARFAARSQTWNPAAPVESVQSRAPATTARKE